MITFESLFEDSTTRSHTKNLLPVRITRNVGRISTPSWPTCMLVLGQCHDEYVVECTVCISGNGKDGIYIGVSVLYL